MRSKRNINPLHYVPILGILLFVVLFIYASSLYPGGSEFDPTTNGFDWARNYWCDLMNPRALNGMYNPARPFSILAWSILCISLMDFFFMMRDLMEGNKCWRYIIPSSGIISMLLLNFIFTPIHHLLIIISSIFGGIALSAIIRELYFKNLKFYLIIGYFNFILISINVFIYLSNTFIIILPIMQKITLLTVFFWISILNLYMIQKVK